MIMKSSIVKISLAEKCPEVAAEWSFEKNKGLTNSYGHDYSRLELVPPSSGVYAWWICPNGHEYEMMISSRTNGHQKCPYCSNRRVLSGYNDLATKRPDIAAEWHPTLNGDVLPSQVGPSSNIPRFWLCIKGHVWEDTPNHRNDCGRGCPYCSGQRTLKGFNDLLTTNPILASQWDYEKNKNVYDQKGRNIATPELLTEKSGINVWWKCKNNHSWFCSPADRSTYNTGCPYCAGKLPTETNNLLVICPELANEWDYDKNKNLKDKTGRDISTPEKITPASSQRVYWKCKKGHSWKASVGNRTSGFGCPICSESHSEKEVRRILESLNITFKEQFSFPDRKYHHRGTLRDDFVILHNNDIIGAIEYNGKQHYEIVDFSGHNPEKAKNEFQHIKDRDKLKTDYLKAHGIQQLVIPYWQFNEIESLVIEFLKELKLIND